MVKQKKNPGNDKTKKRLEKFLNAWKNHVEHELKLHHHIKAGKKSLEHHIKSSIKMHEKLLKELRKI